MKRSIRHIMICFCVFITGITAAWSATPEGNIATWARSGFNSREENFTVSAIAAGWSHFVGIRPDGTLMACGLNNYGECNVPEGTYSSIAAGYNSAYALKPVPEPSGILALLAGVAGTAFRIFNRKYSA